jgi:hypothetical protein
MHSRLLKAQHAAEILGMSIWFVYDHASELGGVRMGRAIRFEEQRVLEYRSQNAIMPSGPEAASQPESVGEPSLHSRRQRRARVPLDPTATRSRPRRVDA